MVRAAFRSNQEHRVAVRGKAKTRLPTIDCQNSTVAATPGGGGQEPVVRHTVTIRQMRTWLADGGDKPSETATKRRLKALLAR